MKFTKPAFSVGAILMVMIAFVEPVQLALSRNCVTQDFKIDTDGRAVTALSLSGSAG